MTSAKRLISRFARTHNRKSCSTTHHYLDSPSDNPGARLPFSTVLFTDVGSLAQGYRPIGDLAR